MYFWRRASGFLAIFLAAETLTRAAFAVKEWRHLDGLAGTAEALAVGLAFDLSVFTYFLVPLSLYLLALPARHHGTRRDRIMTGVLFGLLAYILLFAAVAEWFFWDEFAGRFNFIAVDYLVYTHEVVGNIQESYPIYPLLSGIAAIALAAGWRYARRPLPGYGPPLARRAAAVAACAALAFGAFQTARGSWADGSNNRFVNLHFPRLDAFERVTTGG